MQKVSVWTISSQLSKPDLVVMDELVDVTIAERVVVIRTLSPLVSWTFPLHAVTAVKAEEV